MEDARQRINGERIRTAVYRRTQMVKDLCVPILAALPEVPPIPRTLVFPTLEPFSNIIKNTPLLDDVTEDDFADALTTIPELCSKWREELEARLQVLLVANGQSDDLNLLRSAFDCAHCRRGVLHYPGLTTHSCLYGYALDKVWDASHIIPASQSDQEKIEKLVRLCNLDVNTATSADMDSCDALFSCGDCYDAQLVYERKQVSFMPWRSALVSFFRAPSV